MDKNRRAFLEELMSVWCPSGQEEKAQDVIRRRVQDVCDVVRTDMHGNVMSGINVDAPLRVMFAGHVDEIGLMITHIDENGYCYFQPIGGFDLNVLTGQRVIVHNAKGDVPGVIGRLPIHLLTDEQRKNTPKYEELFIDIGANDEKDALKHVRVSDSVTIDVGMKYLLNDLACSRAFDDRIGAFVVTEALLQVARGKPQVALWSATTVQEELGLRGARTAAYEIDPHVGIAVDVGFASDYPGVEKKKVGGTKVGKGPMVGRGPNINCIVGQMLENVAEAHKIPIQIQAEPRATGTDANAVQISRSGVAAALVSIPNRYMHSPNEIISLKDAENAIDLLAEFVLSLKADDTFIPGITKMPKASKSRSGKK